jgi:putative tryptophan/tyrosine transport system substrate-binding protein
MISRRRLLRILLSGVLASPLAAFPQPSARVHRIGFLGTASASGYVSEVEAVRAGFRELGYVEGRNLVIEYRWADGDPERLRKLAAELVALKVDVIVTHAIPGARAAMRATTTIPIVIADISDPVAAGIVTSLARPGGNVTGTTSFQVEIPAKRLELLKEAAPTVSRAAFLVNARNPDSFTLPRRDVEAAAKAMNLELQEFPIREPGELPEAFDAMSRARIDGVLIGEDPLLNSNAAVLAALAVAHRWPASGFTRFADAGGLLGYGADRDAVYARAAYFVDRILRGAKAGDIPFERATKFELIVNLRTAGALGINVPSALLRRADRRIN